MPNMPPEPEKPKSQQGIFWIFLLFLIVAAGGAAFLYHHSQWRVPAEAKKLQNPVAANQETIASGMKIYMDHCQKCHGGTGNGKGPKAADLSVAPQDFTDTADMSHITDGELYWKVTYGRRPMPSFKDKLTDEQRWQVVAFIRTFAKNSAANTPSHP